MVKKRLTLVKGVIKERKFFEYYDNLALLREIVDDGNAPEKDDLSGVSERKIQIKVYRNSCNALPNEEEERYLDLESGNEILISLIKNHYDSRGRVIRRDVYDANADLVFKKKWEYNSCGSVVREVDAVGNETHRTYDENQNLTSETGTHLNYTKYFTYDKMNRLIQIEEKHSDDSLSTHMHYDLLGQKTK